MLFASFRGGVAVLLISIVGLQFCSSSRVFGQADQPATQPAGQEGLVPCLAVLGDGSPVWASTSFPPAKRITVMFLLPPDADAKMLHSRWVAMGDEEKVLAENSLDLKGQKRGWLQLELKEPAAPGKYRVNSKLDDTEWESVEIEITAPPTEGVAEKPADLIPIDAGKTMTYDFMLQPAPGVKMDVPGAKPGEGGATRSTVEMKYGEADEQGNTHYTAVINGTPVAEMWVKLDEKGLVAVRKKDGEQVVDLNPPQVLQPLPPKLEHDLEWKLETDDGQHQLVMFGPLTLNRPQGPTTGYIIYGEETSVSGGEGTSSVTTVDTMERHYIPQVGLVMERRATLSGGKLVSRQLFVLKGAQPYRLVADPKMKGRLGRLQFAYPPETDFSQARVQVFKVEGEQRKPVADGYGDKSFDLMPGKYEVALNGRAVPVEVKSGHVTQPLCGVLRVHASSETRFKIKDPQDQNELFGAYGEKDVPLPAGTYLIEIAGASEEVTVADGQVVEF